MNQYLLATYGSPGGGSSAPPSPEEMQQRMQGIIALEEEMDQSGTFVFGGHLHGPDATTVVQPGESGPMLTDGPFVESKEHLAGFYIINATDLDAAVEWAKKVTDCIGNVIEVRPFGGTGKAVDNMPG